MGNRIRINVLTSQKTPNNFFSPIPYSRQDQVFELNTRKRLTFNRFKLYTSSRLTPVLHISPYLSFCMLDNQVFLTLVSLSALFFFTNETRFTCMFSPYPWISFHKLHNLHFIIISAPTLFLLYFFSHDSLNPPKHSNRICLHFQIPQSSFQSEINTFQYRLCYIYVTKFILLSQSWGILSNFSFTLRTVPIAISQYN